MSVNLCINEAELVRQCLAGDEKSFSVLYKQHAKGVYHSVLRITGHAEDAEDVVQEAFYKGFTQLERLQNSTNFGAWIKKIAINMAISQLRKKKMSFTDDSQLSQIADDTDTSEEEIFNYQVEEVKAAIEALPDGYRTVLSLYLFEDYSQEDIAKTLGISNATVRSQYHRAKKSIYLSLKDKSYERT